MSNIDNDNKTPFAPELSDLCYLYEQVRKRKALTVLEFGIGYSTIVMAAAMEKNRQEMESEFHKRDIRCLHPFSIYSVDGDQYWIENTRKNIPAELQNIINIKYSSVSIGTFQDRICSYYDDMPDVIPDLIYLDGPAPAHVKGSLGGSSFYSCPERTPNSADILRLESTLVPGSAIIVDGRTNNVRFLENNFQRHWDIFHDMRNDRTTFILNEPPLGIHNRRKLEFQDLL